MGLAAFSQSCSLSLQITDSPPAHPRCCAEFRDAGSTQSCCEVSCRNSEGIHCTVHPGRDLAVPWSRQRHTGPPCNAMSCSAHTEVQTVFVCMVLGFFFSKKTCFCATFGMMGTRSGNQLMGDASVQSAECCWMLSINLSALTVSSWWWSRVGSAGWDDQGGGGLQWWVAG